MDLSYTPPFSSPWTPSRWPLKRGSLRRSHDARSRNRDGRATSARSPIPTPIPVSSSLALFCGTWFVPTRITRKSYHGTLSSPLQTELLAGLDPRTCSHQRGPRAYSFRSSKISKPAARIKSSTFLSSDSHRRYDATTALAVLPASIAGSADRPCSTKSSAPPGFTPAPSRSADSGSKWSKESKSSRPCPR